MRSILPPPLLAATLLTLCACERGNAVADAALQQDAELPAPGREAPEYDADGSEYEAGAPENDGSLHDAGAPMEDAGQGVDADAAAASHRPAARPTLEELMQAYRAWSPHPSEPQAISVQIASLCRLPSAAEQAFVESEHGTDFRLLQNWLNPAAKRGFDDERTPFEVGAAIVKEKLELEHDGTRRLVARGLMVKRERGFDPARGDWEFGYWEPGQELRRGAEAARTCGGCHASASTDFVFLDGRWRLPL